MSEKLLDRFVFEIFFISITLVVILIAYFGFQVNEDLKLAVENNIPLICITGEGNRAVRDYEQIGEKSIADYYRTYYLPNCYILERIN